MSKLCNFDPNDLQSLNWLTSGNLPCLQQHRPGQAEFSMSAQDQLHAGAQLSNMSVTGAGTSMVHVQNNMQHSPLGINSCSHGALYNTFNIQSLFTHQQIHTPHSQEIQPKKFSKPIYSYSCLIAMALKNSKTGSLPVSEIYSFMKEHFPYFKTAPDSWKNSVRHTLSLNKSFEKVENKLKCSPRKGCLWALKPAQIDKMAEHMQIWKREDLPAIRRNMANPDELDKLITDRPECCRRNTLDPQLPPSQPVLPPQCLNVHHQLQLQLHSQPHIAPISPAHAQTPPFYPVPELVRWTPLPPPPASQPQQPPQHPAEIFRNHSHVHSEVDFLVPSILDFDLQENLWDEMKDNSFNLDNFRITFVLTNNFHHRF